MPTRISCLRIFDALAGGLNSSSGPWRSLILFKNNFDNKKLYIFIFKLFKLSNPFSFSNKENTWIFISVKF